MLSPGDEVIFKYKKNILHGIVNTVGDGMYDVCCVSYINKFLGKILPIKYNDIKETHKAKNSRSQTLNISCGLNYNNDYTDFCNTAGEDFADTTFTNLFGCEYSSMLTAYKYYNMTQDILQVTKAYLNSCVNLYSIKMKDDKRESMFISLLNDAIHESIMGSHEDCLWSHSFVESIKTMLFTFKQFDDSELLLKTFSDKIKTELPQTQVDSLITMLGGKPNERV